MTLDRTNGHTRLRASGWLRARRSGELWQTGKTHTYLPDGLVLGTVCLLFIARCALRGCWLMWLDELFSFNLIHDPSATHMLAALGDQADGAPPLYYLLAKGWAAVFSDSPVSLRLFSTTAFCVGFVLLWSAMRRAFNLFTTGIAFIIVIGSNTIVLFESSNVRFYGLLFALLALAVLLAVKLCDSEHAHLLVANALTQGALVLTHPLGGFYGAAILCAVATYHLIGTPSRIRPKVLASYCIGWAAIFLWWQQFIHQAAINEPRGNVPVPDLYGLCIHLFQQSWVFPLLIILALCMAGSIFGTRAGMISAARSPFQLSSSQLATFLVALSLISIGPLFWVISHLMPLHSIFLARYLIGTTIGWAFLFAQLIHCAFKRVVLPSPSLRKGLGFLFISVTLVPLFVPVVVKLSGQAAPDPRAFLSGTSDRAVGQPGLPIVCPGAEEFLARTHYASDAKRYYFLLNGQAPADAGSWPGMAAEYHLLSAIKRHYPEFSNIIDTSEFLHKYPVFLVLNVPEFRWCHYNLDPSIYKVSRLITEPPVRHDHTGKWPLLLVVRHP